MGFLKRFLGPGSPQSYQPGRPSSFHSASTAELEAHLHADRYGDFWLTEAIRPSLDLSVMPRAGYRRDLFRDPSSGHAIPVLAAAASREILFELFIDLLDPLGEQIDVVLESSHDPELEDHIDLYREAMDLVVFKSTLYDFQELLLKDGYTGVAAIQPRAPMEVQFDEHKLLFVYAQDLKPFEKILDSYGVPFTPDLKLISEAEHLHLTEDRFLEEFEELKYRLGVSE